MTDTIVSFVGGVSGASAMGASHEARGQPNQDAVGWGQDRLWTYLAVADGHGSAPHYRSDRGSRMAVDALLALFRDVTAEGTLRQSDVLAARLPDLAASLVERWRDRVEADIASDPVAEPAGFDSLAVYGSTCIGAAIGPGFALFLQIGDGSIFVGAASGDVEQLFPDDGYPGEQTDSLCLPEVAGRAKIGLFTAPSRFCAPDFVLAATDGVTKSYPDPQHLLGAMRASRDAVRKRDLRLLGDEIAGWLATCAAQGSRDDATVALFVYAPGVEPSAAVEAYGGPSAPRPSGAVPGGRPPVRRIGPAATAFGFLAGVVVGHWGPALVARSASTIDLPPPASLHSTRGPL